ncbi:RluA family pseudouridine synthase [Albimonas sp. CAU 1670]|uniref:RluA family pseudouridine synthase n=1 Tax=Albimonas sp. CAU 1670 TaxID=3032599 RepID=UPI0023DB2005|nr:RluA family pseudouridine synthase [Albimonas sp. CAU 1670]MDF2233406.1 RluA family pseudouridine synthase [Albimonas sp. CAU 1670]
MSEHLTEDQDDDGDDGFDGPAAPPAASGPLLFEIPEAQEGERLDKALATLAPPGLSRSRLRALVEGGAAERDGEVVRDPRAKVKAGEVYALEIPAPAPARPEPEAIPLDVVYEDAHLIVVNKPAGMVVHPAPGAMTGTLVNALLAHCAGSLSGVGGEARPGIVHRIDKDTSGLLVVAKSDAAHHGLSERFAAHDLERAYQAFAWAAPMTTDPRALGLPGVEDEGGGWLRIETRLDRHRSDRKRMAVAKAGGRIAVSHLRTLSFAGPPTRPSVSRVECRLETGRTHQIRVHMSWLGCPLVGDATYGGRSRKAPADLGEAAVEALTAFPRQALHAATLGFDHPVTGEPLRFEAPLPPDMQALADALGL